MIVCVAFGKNPVVLIQLMVYVSQMTIDLCLVEVVLFTVLSSEFCAVSSNELSSNKVNVPGYFNSCPEDFPYGLFIILSEV